MRSKFKLVKYKPLAENSVITARINGTDIAVKIGAPGRHIVQNALAVSVRAGLPARTLQRLRSALARWPPKRGAGSATR